MRIPSIFVAHGTPELAEDPARGEALAAWAKDLPRPRGILALSALWQEDVPTRGTTRGGTAAYAPPSASELAYEASALVPIARAERGWDYGVASPVAFMYPEADIPVLQLSLVRGATPRRLFALGQKLGVLAERGILILGSGAFTFDLEGRASERDAPPTEHAREFDGWVANLLADAEVDEIFAWRTMPEARAAHPRLDPLFVVAGAASLYEHAVGFPIRGFDHGTLSRRCVQFGR